MIWSTFVPGLLLIGLSLIMAWKPLPLHPAWTARILFVTGAAAALTVVSAVMFVCVVFVADVLPMTMAESGVFGRFLLRHGPVSPHLVILSFFLLAISMAGGFRFLCGLREEMRVVRHEADRIRGQDHPVAMAVPGEWGGVLISRGLTRLLDRRQLQVVFCHEYSHLRHRHHLYSALGNLFSALVPPLFVLQRSLLLALERWADEDAAEATGDRELVAHTVARVALAAPQARSTWNLALAEAHALTRVQALLEDAPSANRVAGPALFGSTGVASSGIASSSMHLHHLPALLLL